MKVEFKSDIAVVWVIMGIFMILASATIDYKIPEISTDILTTLVAAQTTIFAIVFSVVVVAVQLSTSRYSPRVVGLFKSDKEYKTTIGIFGVSILFSLSTLYVSEIVGKTTLSFLVFGSGWFAGFAFIALYHFVDKILEQTTPEGILDRIEETLEPNDIVKKAEEAADSTKNDPYLVPVSIINSSITDQDTPAVCRGLRIIGSSTENLIKEENITELDNDGQVKNSLEELCANRLPNTIKKAADTGLQQESSSGLSSLEKVGKAAAKENLETTTLYSLQGFGKVISTLEFDKASEEVRGDAIEKSGNVIAEAVENDCFKAAGSGIRVLAIEASNSIETRDSTQNNLFHYSILTMKIIPETFDDLLSKKEDGISEQYIDWTHGLDHSTTDNGQKMSTEIRSLWYCYTSLSQITSAHIRYEEKSDSRQVNWGFVAEGWAKGFRFLTNSDLDLLLQLWLGTILYLDYLRFESVNHVMKNGNIMIRIDPSDELLSSTYDSILSGEIDPQYHIDNLQLGSDHVSDISISTSPRPVTDRDCSFEEYIENKIERDCAEI
ncbi:DUF2254 family protein [Natrinema amylolyticum]|uniref:DUF2254 family protein n=1 Tax=Natrinema amylolyticum TaxID=2878679 RepID=UPI001CFADA0A|nr:DUF2254 family protein [Natrinema amylolyticum]